MTKVCAQSTILSNEEEHLVECRLCGRSNGSKLLHEWQVLLTVLANIIVASPICFLREQVKLKGGGLCKQHGLVFWEQYWVH